ncbi:putative RNA-binding protein associated with RNAse of E/G family [Nocardioides sp. BE266]|uniref:DUF402 domain-containing protein n=1 Tax=Nocardioides sp. BE266 TaxID=2817725 RepID=UPI0028616BFF|nr:DUF402 domain-containing protein [Nocardioides sp. BE266]MDR7253949.1 putative RNA-binding protein associated with RNAse of E/G family [Nocardioides sp. BE266]
MTDPDVQISDSGGTMQRLTGAAVHRAVDLEVLETERWVGAGPDWHDAGAAPFLEPGSVVHWRYGHRIDPMRVVRDDARGLVAWLAEETEVLSSARAGGVGVRDVPLEERFTGERVPVLGRWRGTGTLRIAPTGRPWSAWLFWDDDGGFAGHYVNLELTHRRRGCDTATRDLTLDLWLEPSGALWLKDADELEAATQAARYSPAQADEVHAIADWARSELVEGRDWPLDEEWTTWRPPASWTVPPLPDTDDVRAARATILRS